MKNKAEVSSNIIAQMLQQTQPCFYTCHLREDFVVLCQSISGNEIAKVIADFLHISLRYFLTYIIPEATQNEALNQEYHKTKLANLILSCRQEIQQKNVQGSCFFGACYLFKNSLFCLRSQGIEMFLFDQDSNRIWAINGSTQYQNSKRNKSKNIQQSYFCVSMPKIKTEYLFQMVDGNKKQLHFEKVVLSDFPASKNLKLLVGCSQTFDILTTDFLFKYFKDNCQKTDCEKVNGLLEEAKKKIKSVYHLNLSLICWKVDNSEPSIARIPLRQQK